MAFPTKETFETLANFDNNPCISIYMPTHKAGKDVLEEKDRIQLKSQWKKVYEKLKDLNWSSDKINKLGKPVEQLLEDKAFWRFQSSGLAIFLADGYFEKFTVPIEFEPFVCVADHFYLKPLVPIFTGDAPFYVLCLQMDKVKFYEASRYSMEEVDIDELTPSQLEERVGFDYEEKNLQNEVQNTLTGTTTVQGHGAAERDRKNEFLRFFRAVDKGLHQILRDKKAPLIVACQDYLFPIYQKANTYKHLFPKSVPGNPSDYENKQVLHAAALEQLEPYFNKEKDEKMKQFKEMDPQKTSIDASEIIPAIYEGKVDTVFLQNKEDLWGKYNENMASVELVDEPSPGDMSLMNLAAVKVMQQGGKVYLVEGQFMPDKNSKMNAVFRY